MAGRNWTRKSIEELIDSYLRTKGGGGGSGGEKTPYAYETLGVLGTLGELGVVWGDIELYSPEQSISYIHGEKVGKLFRLYGTFLVVENNNEKLVDRAKAGIAAGNLSFTSMRYTYFVEEGSSLKFYKIISNKQILVNSSYKSFVDTGFFNQTFYTYIYYSSQFFNTQDILNDLDVSEFASKRGRYIFTSYEFTEADFRKAYNDDTITIEEVTL